MDIESDQRKLRSSWLAADSLSHCMPSVRGRQRPRLAFTWFIKSSGLQLKTIWAPPETPIRRPRRPHTIAGSPAACHHDLRLESGYNRDNLSKRPASIVARLNVIPTDIDYFKCDARPELSTSDKDLLPRCLVWWSTGKWGIIILLPLVHPPAPWHIIRFEWGLRMRVNEFFRLSWQFTTNCWTWCGSF